MSNTEYRVVIKFFTWKGLIATPIAKELADVHDDSAPPYRTVAKWVAEFIRSDISLRRFTTKWSNSNHADR